MFSPNAAGLCSTVNSTAFSAKVLQKRNLPGQQGYEHGDAGQHVVLNRVDLELHVVYNLQRT